MYSIRVGVANTLLMPCLLIEGVWRTADALYPLMTLRGPAAGSGDRTQPVDSADLPMITQSGGTPNKYTGRGK